MSVSGLCPAPYVVQDPVLPEGVKKFAWLFSPSFRRRPESSIFKPLRTAWTPVFTGETTKWRFFHTFSPRRGKEDEDKNHSYAFLIMDLTQKPCRERLWLSRRGKVEGAGSLGANGFLIVPYQLIWEHNGHKS